MSSKIGTIWKTFARAFKLEGVASNVTTVDLMKSKDHNFTDHRYLTALVAGMLVFASDYGFAGETDTSSTHREEKEISLTELLDMISLQAGYEIELVNGPPNKTVTTPIRGLSVQAALKRILKELDSTSHVLDFDIKEKKIKIILMHSSSAEDQPSQRSLSSEIKSIGPPSPIGDPGITPSELAAIKAHHRERELSRDPNAEISPPSEYGPGLTLAELESIKNEHREATENQLSGAEITPPSEYGTGLTVAELDELKALHRERSEIARTATIVSPSSMEGPGLTQGELENIKSAHRGRLVLSSATVTPPSSQGPGLTLAEVHGIKAEHNKNLVLH